MRPAPKRKIALQQFERSKPKFKSEYFYDSRLVVAPQPGMPVAIRWEE
jgi:hypothetical protein